MKKYIFSICIACLLFACKDEKTSSPKHESHSHENAEHGHNHANKHMHNTPVADLIQAFESPERDKTQKPDQVIEILGNLDGKKILDIGAGSGYFSYRLANQGAHVIAGDVDDEFLDYIKKKNATIKLRKGSVTPKKLPYDSPALSPKEIDDAIIVNTYHHIENRVGYFKEVLEGLKPGGRLIVVDFMKKHFEEKVKGPSYEMRISSDVVMQELTESGFSKFEINNELLPYQYILIAWKDVDSNNQEKNKNLLENFKELNTEKINEKLAAYRHEFTPEQVMREYYPLEVNENEGKEIITINSQELSNGMMQVTLIHDNLLDDSMRGKKIVMELHKKNRKWMVSSLKKNWRCWTNRGHENWGIENCN